MRTLYTNSDPFTSGAARCFGLSLTLPNLVCMCVCANLLCSTIELSAHHRPSSPPTPSTPCDTVIPTHLSIHRHPLSRDRLYHITVTELLLVAFNPANMAPPHSRPAVAPQLLELPLQLAIVAFSVTLLGLNAWDYSRWQILKTKSEITGLVSLSDNGMLNVVLAGMIVSAVAFAFGNLAAFLACLQFPKRRGERTGKGTYGYVLVGLVELVLSGAFLGIAAAYTAYAVNKHPVFERGPNYQEPLEQISRFSSTPSTTCLPQVKTATLPPLQRSKRRP